MTMAKEKAMKMFELLDKQDEMTKADVDFMSNNLAPFADLLVEIGATMMIEAGIDKDNALALLENLSMVSRMAGASNFRDFVQVEQMRG